MNLQLLMDNESLIAALKHLKIASPTQYLDLMRALAAKLDHETKNLLVAPTDKIVRAQGRTSMLFELLDHMDHCDARHVAIQEWRQKQPVNKG